MEWDSPSMRTLGNFDCGMLWFLSFVVDLAIPYSLLEIISFFSSTVTVYERPHDTKQNECGTQVPC